MLHLPGSPIPLDRARLERAVEAANVPTLVLVLFQLTGDEAWLRAPYAPTRAPGLDDHDATGARSAATWSPYRGGSDSPTQTWAMCNASSGSGEGTAAGLPVDQATTASTAVARISAWTDPGSPPLSTLAPLPTNDFSVLVIGAGVSGLTAALQLRSAGVRVRVLERNDRAGGVWADNGYPGARVDTPSYVYSCSYFPRNWSTHFGKRDEVLRYLTDLVDHFDLAPHVTFDIEATDARWDEDARRWHVTARNGDGREEEFEANAVITAVGLLNRPKLPEIAGLAESSVTIFHSARWPDDLNLHGKRVAVIGSGASAMQIVPAVVDQVAELTVFQRSPQWAAPDANYFQPVTDDARWLIEHVPYYHHWYRFRLNWTFGDRNHASLRIDDEWPHPERSLNKINDGHRKFFTDYIREQLAGRDDLIAASVPTYPPFGKRMLLDNGWYRALTREHVTLVTDVVVEITEDGVRDAAGGEHRADVVVLCTGFDAQRPVHPMAVTGRDGVTLSSIWGLDDPRAYLGITAPHFPNLFFLYGPNSNAGGGAVIATIEQQVGYVEQLVREMVAGGLMSIECRADVHDAYNERVDAEHGRLVWSHPGMQTYYRNAKGRVVTNMPWPIVEYWHLVRHADLDDFVIS